MSAHTLAEKILMRASGAASVRAGEIVVAKVDLAMMHDSGGPRRVAPYLQQLEAKVWDPEKVVLVSDHYVPAVDPQSAAILSLTRRWAHENGITRFHDMQGICHVVLQEYAHLRPGMLVVGGDSHSPSGGAVGAFMVGIGATEMAGVLATGEIWLRVPETVRVSWTGQLAAGVCAKDMMLALCRDLGQNNDYKAIEYCGSAVTALPMAERFVLCNMSAELGAKTGMIAPDEKTLAEIRANGGDIADSALQWRSDENAAIERVVEFDAGRLAPQVAAPHSPGNSLAVDQVGRVRIDQAYIGACTGAKLTDLQMAAQVLRGKKVAPHVRLLVAPASLRTTQLAAADGTLATLTAAGAILLPTGCGACAGYGAGVLAEGEVCISSTARNFKGRMGHATSQVYLGSPFTVAASAVTGHVTDPRALLH
ncbi:MAG TPA: 3-isopropylmalate dehydratase large subunit [Steroidobacteraceae bacterium]|jgi:3-isopropylmalate/(R)-2-methylmalate dehydratase large subunit|nr:3-isopropylmalate dehydratase large subunit [Steroidobacteraceae bacterium]